MTLTVFACVNEYVNDLVVVYRLQLLYDVQGKRHVSVHLLFAHAGHPLPLCVILVIFALNSLQRVAPATTPVADDDPPILIPR